MNWERGARGVVRTSTKSTGDSGKKIGAGKKKSRGLSINEMPRSIITARARIDKIRLEQPASNIKSLTA